MDCVEHYMVIIDKYENALYQISRLREGPYHKGETYYTEREMQKIAEEVLKEIDEM